MLNDHYMNGRRILDWLFAVPADALSERRQKYVDGLKFRALVSAAFALLFVLLAQFVPDWQLPLTEVLPALALLVLINPVYWLLGQQSDFSLRYFYLHWLIDVLLISTVLFPLGGIDLPYGLLAYLMLVVTSSTFLSMRASMVVATGATVATVLLAALQTAQILEGPRVWASDSTLGTRLIGVACAVLFYYVFAYLAGSLADQLKSVNLSLRAAHAKIEEQNRLLEEKVADRTRELESRNSEIEEFVHIVTHDLKNVSVGATETARLLLAHVTGHLDMKNQRYASHLLEDTRRMNEMLVQLLGLFRIDRRTARSDSVDLKEMASDLMRGFSVRVDSRRIRVIVGTLPVLQADELQLRHVLGNLLDNAIKYTGSHATPEVRVSCTKRPDEWVIEVQDNGIGIPLSQQERIFQLYFRGSNQEVRGIVQEGEGVGLAICKRIVERWGGRIWVESEVGGGTRMSFSVPRSA